MRDNRILVVSDDFQFCTLIQNAIQDSNIGTCKIATASGLQDDFSHCTCRLIIVDIPHLSISGIDVLDAIGKIQQSQSMPILILTKKVTAKDKAVLFHAGANACLEVPVDLSPAIL